MKEAGAPPARPSPESRSAWDAYWQSPRLAACLRNRDGNYDGEIARRWQRWFAVLPRRASLLDIATGNGAVALLALEHAERSGFDWRITGVDSARIDPAAALPHLSGPLGRIRFLGETPAERLPFADSSFDALSGQYAIEYTDLPRTIDEVARVLRPSGRVMFITHRRDSSVCRETERQLKLIGRIDDLRLLPGVRSLLTCEKDSVEWRQARQAFDAAAASAFELMDAYPGQGRDFLIELLRQIGEIYQTRNPLDPETALRQLDGVAADLAGHGTRLKALRESALDEPGVGHVLSCLERSGLTGVRSGPLRDPKSGDTLGHCFEAGSPAAAQ